VIKDKPAVLDYDKLAMLPLAVKMFCRNNRGWIVGGAARWLLGRADEPPRDWDIIIPLAEWPAAAGSIPRGSVTNSHGGVKLVADGAQIDVWPGDIGAFLGQIPFDNRAYAVHPSTTTVLISWRGWGANINP